METSQLTVPMLKPCLKPSYHSLSQAINRLFNVTRIMESKKE